MPYGMDAFMLGIGMLGKLIMMMTAIFDVHDGPPNTVKTPSIRSYFA